MIYGHLGKQIVYHALQDPDDASSPGELAVMDQQIEALREEIAGAKASEKLLKVNITTLNATMTVDDIRGAIVSLEVQRDRLLERLEPLRSGTAFPVSSDEKAVIDQAWAEWQRKWHTRKKIAMDVWAHATEVLPEGMAKEELWVGHSSALG